MTSFLSTELITALRGQLMTDIQMFLPELILAGGVILMLLLRLAKAADALHMGYIALAAVVISAGGAWTDWIGDGTSPNVVRELFGGLLVYDNFTLYFRLFLLATAALTIWLSLLTGIPDKEDSADFFCLLLGAVVGMMLMASSNHLIMVFIAVEMASLPSYAMAGFLKGRRQSSEASLKYVVYGGAAAGVMLYGISLITGRFGTGYMPEVASGFSHMVAETGFDAILFIGLLLILVGFAFKLSAVPFHFWCPDVFEGAAAEVAAFLSVASKAAALALLGRFSLTMIGAAPGLESLTIEQWQPLVGYLGPAIAFFAAVTASFGNLAAYAQTNIKRLLAYSTIAHAGYMMMAVATLTREGLDGVLLYLAVYMFMNLGAFAIIAFLRNRIGSEEINDYAGMIQRAPLLTISFAILLLSLVGLPPLAGYMAKFQIFAALYEASVKYENNGLMVLLVVGLINTVISLVYYVRVLKVMIIESPPGGSDEEGLRIPLGHNAYALITALAVAVGIFFWDPLARLSGKGVSQFPTVEAAKTSVETAGR